MKHHLINALLVLGMAACLAFLSTGCNRGAKLQQQGATVIASQTAKDATVVGAADRIDIAAPAPAVRVETDTIRAAVKAAPAAQVEQIVAAQSARIKDLEDSATRTIKLVIFGIAAAGMIAGAVIGFYLQQPRAGGAIAAGAAAAFALGLAYEWAQRNQWAVGISFALVAAGGALMYANRWHSRDAAKLKSADPR